MKSVLKPDGIPVPISIVHYKGHTVPGARWATNQKDCSDEQRFLMNHLLQGDKGYTITEIFSALRTAELEFISMVNWRQWDLMDLFKEKDPENLPVSK